MLDVKANRDEKYASKPNPGLKYFDCIAGTNRLESTREENAGLFVCLRQTNSI